MFYSSVDTDVGEGNATRDHVKVYECKIGRNCEIESYVSTEKSVTIGDDCKVKPHAFIPTGVVIEDRVFIGPNVTFTNGNYPKASGDWELLRTFAGARAVVAKDFPDFQKYVLTVPSHCHSSARPRESSTRAHRARISCKADYLECCIAR